MTTKNIDQINEADLRALKDNSVSEGKTMEYKQELPSTSELSKQEFLADISSFANASGGDLIFGVTESAGIPTSIDGLIIADIDQEKLRLENLIRDGIQPRVLGTNVRVIPLTNSRVVILVRVAKSWNSPHRVIFRGHDKFYTRNSSGKYPMDVSELKIAFNMSEAVAERIRRFNIDRASKIISGETPIKLEGNTKIVLHIIPFVSFSPAQHYDLTPITSHPEKMAPMYSRGWNNRYNLDGFVTYSQIGRGKSSSYTQLFRSGIIEAVETLLLEPTGTELYIPDIAYEQELMKSLADYISVLKTLRVEPPTFLFLDLFGVRGYSMPMRQRSGFMDSHKIDRDALLLPELIVDSYDVRPEDVLRPAFDSIWNACGFPRSLNYNEQGNWVGTR